MPEDLFRLVPASTPDEVPHRVNELLPRRLVLVVAAGQLVVELASRHTTASDRLHRSRNQRGDQLYGTLSSPTFHVSSRF